MTAQQRLTERVTKKARAMANAGGVHKLSDMSFRIVSLSKPGTYHQVYLKWLPGSGPGMTAGLTVSCAWVEPVTGSQTHCPGNGHTACWHVLASIINKLENGQKVAFFSDKKVAERYARFGGHPVPIVGKGIWFVVNGKG